MLGKKKQILAIYLSLTVITLIAFWQVSRCDFINFDDPIYVTENVHVQNGITAGALSWAFTTGHAANWHPLTWISHMFDVRLFGLNPHGHHLISLLLHIANTLLLFFVLHRMTKATWKSAFVAALFAIHPLHVESVAWVAERKDVLSTFFWMLTMCAYVYYAEQPRVRSYLAVFAFFALGLMAKPMLVTLPFVLLLLDYWPMQRLRAAGSREQEASSANQNPSLERKPLSANKTKGKSGKKRTGPGVAKPSAARATSSSSAIGLSSARPDAISAPSSVLRFLLLEKTPLFALAAVSATAAFIAQKKGGSVASLEAIPAVTRIANALVSYIVYIRKMIWPADLAMYYPYPGPLSIWHALGASLLLAALTFAVIRRAKSFPYLAVGWLWFAGTLVPVIGIVQIGNQAMADRYTYVPMIGLFIMAAWGIPELFKRWRFRKELLAASSALVLACFLIVTWTQVGYWSDSFTLYDHTLEVTGRNALVQHNRGVSYAKLGNHKQAIEDFNKTIEIDPQYVDAYNGRGFAYGELGNYSQAISDFNRAIQVDPKCVDAYNNLGRMYTKLGNRKQAIEDYEKAIDLDPNYAKAYYNRGVVYLELDNYSQAISDFAKAIEINPKYAEAYSNVGVAYAKSGNFIQAISAFDKAIEIDPRYTDAYNNRKVAYEDLKTAARLDNEDAKDYLRNHGADW